MRNVLWLCAALCCLGACKGDQGDSGLTGPTGPVGSTGPAGPTVSRDHLPCRQPDGGILPQEVAMVDIGFSCIDRDDSFGIVSEFQVAALQCQQAGRRLCTYGEWYAACRGFADRVLLMTDGWERVDAVYPDGDGGVMSLVVGNGSCEAAQLVPMREQFRYRCCQ